MSPEKLELLIRRYTLNIWAIAKSETIYTATKCGEKVYKASFWGFPQLIETKLGFVLCDQLLIPDR